MVAEEKSHTVFDSCLYTAEVFHRRFYPKDHQFKTNIFQFYLNLDDVDLLSQKFWWLSQNKWNCFSFYDSDHLAINEDKPLKERLASWLKTKQQDFTLGNVMMLTNLRVFGYVFNPVSFYYCFDTDHQLRCVVAEVGNTFGEMKLFLLPQRNEESGMFDGTATKHYYVSPFLELDQVFEFKVGVPAETLSIQINTLAKPKHKVSHPKSLVATLTGQAKKLSTLNIIALGLRMPFVTLKIITLIHWHALLLWFKQIPYFAKDYQPELQQGVLRSTLTAK